MSGSPAPGGRPLPRGADKRTPDPLPDGARGDGELADAPVPLAGEVRDLPDTNHPGDLPPAAGGLAAALTATKTAPSPRAAASSESASQRFPASLASAWSRHGAIPSASLGASAKIAAMSLRPAARTHTFTSFIDKA